MIIYLLVIWTRFSLTVLKVQQKSSTKMDLNMKEALRTINTMVEVFININQQVIHMKENITKAKNTDSAPKLILIALIIQASLKTEIKPDSGFIPLTMMTSMLVNGLIMTEKVLGFICIMTDYLKWDRKNRTYSLII